MKEKTDEIIPFEKTKGYLMFRSTNYPDGYNINKGLWEAIIKKIKVEILKGEKK